METRQLISSGAIWEVIVGYSRAVRVGNIIEVAGTTASQGDKVVAPGDLFGQCMYIFEKIEKTLTQAGAGMQHVVRTRTFVTDISRWEEFARAHAHWFSNIKPAASLLEVSNLISPDLLVEIEVTAILPA